MNSKKMLDSLALDYKKDIYNKFIQIIEKYTLISDGDTIAVEVSMENNVLALLNCMRRYQVEEKKKFTMEYFVVIQDSKVDQETNMILEQYKIHNYHIVHKEDTSNIYSIIKEQGCNKVALPINYTSIVNATFMTFMQKKEVAKIHPKSETNHVTGLACIRPLCLIESHVIEQWAKEMEISSEQAESLFSKVALIDDGFVMHKANTLPQFHFAVYESV